jgi:hypothetical protein
LCKTNVSPILYKCTVEKTGDQREEETAHLLAPGKRRWPPTSPWPLGVLTLHASGSSFLVYWGMDSSFSRGKK